MDKPTKSSTVTSNVVISRSADDAWQTIKHLRGCRTKAEALELILPEALSGELDRKQAELKAAAESAA